MLPESRTNECVTLAKSDACAFVLVPRRGTSNDRSQESMCFFEATIFLFAQEQATADPGVQQQIFEQIPFIVIFSPKMDPTWR